jgi:hypothetical protein
MDSVPPLGGWCVAVYGDLDRACRQTRMRLAPAEEAGVPMVIALSTFLLARLAQERGDTAEARQRLVVRMRAISEEMASQSSS